MEENKETYVILRRVPSPKNRIIVALDVDQPAKAEKLIEQLSPHVGMFKNGLESMHAMRRNLLVSEDEGVAIESLRSYRRLHRLAGRQSFDDAKLMDIPNTVKGASFCISELGVRMFNVHCLGGPAMMEAAVKAASGFQKERPLVIGVTVLTSLNYEDFTKMGILLGWYSEGPVSQEEYNKSKMRELVVNLAKLAKNCGLDGVVCSPQEASAIREACGPRFRLVCPSIRSKDAPPDDQKRTMTPGEAIKSGADYLVIGRPITGAPDPVAAAKAIADEIAQALQEVDR